VMGSDIRSSYNAETGPLRFGRLRQVASGLESSQGGAGAAEAVYEGPAWDSQRVGRFLVGQARDGYEMQGGALLVRKPHEGSLDLLKPHPAFLLGRRCRVGQGSSLLQAACLSRMAAVAVDKGVVQDREQPATQISAGPEGAPPFIGADKGVLHEILCMGLIAGQGSGIAPQRPEQPDDIHPLRVVHLRYTELVESLIPAAVRFLTQSQSC
jgi:hypothetical protein